MEDMEVAGVVVVLVVVIGQSGTCGKWLIFSFFYWRCHFPSFFLPANNPICIITSDQLPLDLTYSFAASASI